MSGSCLERLFAPLTAATFLSQHWPGNHLVCHGPLERLEPLAELPELSSLDALLQTHRDTVRVALADKRDEHVSVQVDAIRAAAMHREGMALIFDDVERFMPAVQQWLEALRRELGLPLGCDARSLVYASPAGGGNSPHFDANANFVVQLRGTKRWHLAVNRHVENPTDRWAMNQDGLPDELAGYVDALLPTELPKDAETIDLRPGSVLFVPRGTWHATEANEVNFTYGQPTWADVVVAALRNQLLKDVRWRALAGSREGLVSRLAELQQEVGKLNADELLEAIYGPTVFQLVPIAFVRIEGGKAIGSLGKSLPFEIEAAEELHLALEWIAGQGEPFSLDELATHFPTLAGGLAGLLQTLVLRGVLRTVAGR